MNKTDIEYLDYTWSPIAMRCTPKSTGCLNCWHLKVVGRLMNNPTMPKRKRDAWAGGEYVLDSHEIMAPRKTRKPSVIGVQFMGDLFHWSIKYSDFKQVMNIITLSKKHTFIMLTKRPNRMRSFIERYYSARGWWGGALPNLWLGVSCSVQKDADKYLPILAKIPAAKRFVSFEPLLGGVAIPNRTDLDWVIAGCESGSKRRKSKIDWFQYMRDLCGFADIPFFLKQMEIDEKIVSMPELDGKVWDQYPEQTFPSF
ncbi:MAG: hypothetical protein BBJ57_07270 [Desulfobacterales bacterium PC51MH44]|nr:MAG: hypothetical protein BBJ57_07270 [Desulfobacterales bacterium PC51MH44]